MKYYKKKTFLYIKKNTQQTAKAHDFPVRNNLSQIVAPEFFLLSFLSEQAYFVSGHQCCRYTSKLTMHMPQNSENAFN